MEIKCVKNGNVKTYYLDGELNTLTSKTLADQIDTSSCDKIIFDMEKLKYITSAGIRVLAETLFQMKEKGGSVSVRNVNENVDQIFNMVGIYMEIDKID